MAAVPEAAAATKAEISDAVEVSNAGNAQNTLNWDKGNDKLRVAENQSPKVGFKCDACQAAD